MGFKLLLVFLSTIVLIQANFTDLQTEFMEMKQELHNLQILVSDIRSEQHELRQLSNDHVIIHWIKNTIVDLRKEMNEFTVQKERSTAVDRQLETEMREIRLYMEKPTIHKVIIIKYF